MSQEENEEVLTDTLIVRVESLVDAGKTVPLLSTTSNTVAIQELIARVEALEAALREIALEVQKPTERSI